MKLLTKQECKNYLFNLGFILEQTKSEMTGNIVYYIRGSFDNEAEDIIYLEEQGLVERKTDHRGWIRFYFTGAPWSFVELEPKVGYNRQTMPLYMIKEMITKAKLYTIFS